MSSLAQLEHLWMHIQELKRYANKDEHYARVIALYIEYKNKGGLRHDEKLDDFIHRKGGK
jgi:hypothetical protein